MLEKLKTWRLENKDVLEFGGGWSTVWWALKCKYLTTIETNLSWAEDIAAYMRTIPQNRGNWEIITPTNLEDGTGKAEQYLACVPELAEFDIIIVDGIYRTEAVAWSIEKLKHRGGILICDNWQQDYVWISPAAEEMVKPYEGEIFQQPGHSDHEGRPWQTGFWYIK